MRRTDHPRRQIHARTENTGPLRRADEKFAGPTGKIHHRFGIRRSEQVDHYVEISARHRARDLQTMMQGLEDLEPVVQVVHVQAGLHEHIVGQRWPGHPSSMAEPRGPHGNRPPRAGPDPRATLAP